jgi:hypothetical protein
VSNKGKIHRNFNKRVIIPGAILFITTNTKNRAPWFYDDRLCGIFMKDGFGLIIDM